jgi:TolB protein
VRGHLALLAALPLFAVGCGAADSSGGKPQNGLIAAANEDGIQLLEPDGSGARLVPGTKGAAEPTWSPDGKWLAFTTTALVDDSVSSDLHVIRSDGKARELVLRNASGPSWSPDGKRIAVMRDSCLGRGEDCLLELENPFDVYTVGVDGRDLRAVSTHPDYDGDPVWSPDGEWIAFSRTDGIYLVRPDGNGLMRLLEGESFTARAWSPDGSKLAFELIEDPAGTGMEIGVVDVETRNQTNLTQRPGHDLFPTWSPDGEQIVFLANSECLRTGECTAHEPWEVWVMDADGRNARPLTKEGFGPPSWGPRTS